MRPRNPALRASTRFNFTPLIDMVFTMLIFFMLTLHIEKEMASKVSLPKADQAAQMEKLPPRSLVVLVAPDGTLIVNGALQTLADFESSVGSYTPDSVPEELVVRGDGNVRYDVIQGVMRAASEAGVSKVNLAASRESEDLR